MTRPPRPEGHPHRTTFHPQTAIVRICAPATPSQPTRAITRWRASAPSWSVQARAPHAVRHCALDRHRDPV